jgi:hypothetical protein
MKNHPDRVQGDDAKKAATAKFSEISAAYELLTTRGDVCAASASHPSFSNSANRNGGGESRFASPYDYDRFSGGGSHPQPFRNTFGMGLDPFGFGTFDSFHFTDPFELFQRTFDDNASFGMAFASNRSFMPHGDLMGMRSGFGGFPSVFGDAMMGSFPGGSGATSFSSSSFRFGTGGATGGGRMISTTTTMVNGKTVTRTEQTVINADGTRSTIVDLTGDDIIDDRPIPAIQADDRKKRTKYDGQLLDQPQVVTPPRSSLQKGRKYNDTTKKESSKLKPSKGKKSYGAAASATSNDNVPSNSHVSKNERYVTNVSNPQEASNKKNISIPSTNDSTPHKRKNQDTEPRASRKRKFCDIMYRCLLCCFPPCKRRRVANDSCH